MHEIKNPLNSVNHFSALSTELIDELREVLVPEPLVETVRAEVDDLTTMLKGNAVESEVGDHTEFTITLPRKMFAGDESRP